MSRNLVTSPTSGDRQAVGRNAGCAMVDAFPDAVAIVGIDGVVTDVNRSMVALIGRGREEVVGAALRECFADETLAESAVRQAFAVGSVADCELIVGKTVDGVVVSSVVGQGSTFTVSLDGQ